MKDLKPNILIVLFLLLGLGNIYSQDSNSIQKNKNIQMDTILANSNISTDNDIELQGFVIDQTQSKWGKDFFEIFTGNWTPPKNVKTYTISIGEKIVPGLSTQIIVNINGDDIYQNFIKPRYESILEEAAQVVNIASTYLINYEEIQAEIRGSDLKGTGIY